MAPYCSVESVNVGNITLPRGFNKAHYVNISADEMDVELGKVYKLPLGPNYDPGSWAGKLLAKINRYLATGKIVIDAAAGGEDRSLNSYGYYHVRQANDALAAIVAGTIDLPFDSIDTDPDRVGPVQIENREPASFVDAFYQQSIGEEAVSNKVYPNNRPIFPGVL